MSTGGGGSGWAKSPPGLVAAFSTVLDEFPDAERRSMFGYPCAFVRGYMVTGLHASSWFVRLGPDGLERFLEQEGAMRFEPMPGRPMAGYAVFPADAVDRPDVVRPWVELALDHARSLPPKEPRPRTGGSRGKRPARPSPAT